MIKTMSIIYFLSYLSKGLSKVKDKQTNEKKKHQFSVRRCRFTKDISLLSFLIQHIYRSPLCND